MIRKAGVRIINRTVAILNILCRAIVIKQVLIFYIAQMQMPALSISMITRLSTFSFFHFSVFLYVFLSVFGGFPSVFSVVLSVFCVCLSTFLYLFFLFFVSVSLSVFVSVSLPVCVFVFLSVLFVCVFLSVFCLSFSSCIPRPFSDLEFYKYYKIGCFMCKGWFYYCIWDGLG